MLSGKWTYRSFRNDPVLVGRDAAAALALILGEGIFDLEAGANGQFRGALGLGPDLALTIAGKTIGAGAALRYKMLGLGIAGTPSEGWRFDYCCSPGHVWPNGVDQLPALTGTVVQASAQGPWPSAGQVASFIALCQTAGAAQPRRTYRRNVLTAGL
jgi:hypothetical protein